MIMDDLIRLFQPIVYLHSKEEYMPCSFEWYLSHSALCLKDVTLYERGVLTRSTLTVCSDANLHPQDQYLKFYEDIKAPLANQDAKELQDIPVYVKFRDSDPLFYEICYIYFFAYNAPYKILGGLFSAGEHYADFEHVTVRVLKDTLKLHSIYFSAHSLPEGAWIFPKDIELEFDYREQKWHNVVYCALGSHGMYWKAQRYWRIAGFANDLTDNGQAWLSKDLIVLNNNNDGETEWNKFQGYLGAPDHVHTPLN